MSAAELAVLRPRMQDLQQQGEKLSDDVRSMERALGDAIKNADRSAVQLRGYAVNIGELTHQLNSLRGSITLLLDELDALDPPAPANSNNTRPAPKKGGGA